MFDFLFRFLERSENQRKAQVSFVLSLLLVANISAWLFKEAIGPYRMIRLDQADEIFRFVFGGGLVVVLIFFFVAWVVLHNSVDYLISISYPFFARGLWTFLQGIVVTLQSPEKKHVRFLRGFLETLGLVKLRDQRLEPGVYLIEFAKNLRKAFEGKPHDSEPKKPASAVLVVQFLVTYWLVAKPLFPLPLIVDIGFYILASVLIALDVFLNGFFHMVLLHKDDIIGLISSDTVTGQSPS